MEQIASYDSEPAPCLNTATLAALADGVILLVYNRPCLDLLIDEVQAVENVTLEE